MRFDREHIAELRDRVDLEAFGVADYDGLEALRRPEMYRGRMPEIGLDPVDLVFIIDGGADADIERAALGGGFGIGGNRKGKRQEKRGEERRQGFHLGQFSRVSASTR